MAERRYRSDEVREIFDLASSAAEGPSPAVTGGAALPDEEGMTLSELQEVGHEVGLPSARVAEAARSIDTRRETLPRETYLGAPTSVGRVIDLPRDLTDREWDILVGELRETFGARGTVVTNGGIREWANGNLHAFLEPTETGHRLRMTTRKETAVPLLTVGTVGLVLGMALIFLFVMEGLAPATAVAVLISLTGGSILATNRIRLPRWAREREDQMEHIAGRAASLAGEPAP